MENNLFELFHSWVAGMQKLALIALSAVQSSARTFSHNAILFIDTSDND